MYESAESGTSKAAEHSNVENTDIEMDDIEDNEDNLLWCIEDDTLFFAQGLKHHSAGKGKSVYVTWNENYLLNFVFKSSTKTRRTTLTKVRISLPVHEQAEQISNMLILEMNTLLYMKSGRVYYFSSVKSMHQVDWLTGVRCVASCPHTQFSVIRIVCCSQPGEHDINRRLCLEVYKDVPQLGKCSIDDILQRSYNISFDSENLFNCDWLDESYTLLSLVTDENNLIFLTQLLSVGASFRPEEDTIDLDINQEVHIFSISGNIFILVGAARSKDGSKSLSPQIEDYSIHQLNTYACAIECVKVDFKNNLLIVLLQTGYIDIWYKSNRKFGALFHYQREISHYLYYDYSPRDNIFYFTTQEDIIQLQIITHYSINDDMECTVKETRKYIGGMMACTFVEELHQLICLSINNIFYRIRFYMELGIIICLRPTKIIIIPP